MNTNILALSSGAKIGIIAGAAAVVVVLILAVIIAVAKKRGAHKGEEHLYDRELVEQNSKMVEALLVLTEKMPEIHRELTLIQEQIRYLIPSENQKVIDYDKKIQSAIQDFRIVLIKADGEENQKCGAALQELKLAIADRNARV